jgi:hypothetical protein
MGNVLKTEVTLTESGFLFDHSTGLTYSLNPTGLFVFQQIQAGKTVGEILGLMMEEFAVNEETARQDLEDYFRQLREMGFIG